MLSLLWANLNRKRLRLFLTISSIAVAFILFGLAEALQFALTGGVELAGQDRLVTMNKYSLIQPLPRSYLARIQAVPGVRVAISTNWFGGYYQEPQNGVFSFAVQNEAQLRDVYPEMKIPPEQFNAWLQERDGALIGRALANSQHWKVGDVIPLRSTIYRKTDGDNTWPMKVMGIFDIPAGNTNGLDFHYDYFNESPLTFGRDYIGTVTLRVADKNKSVEVAYAIDALFLNSETETKTSTEKAFLQGFANQIGNIGKMVTVIVAAVFFTMLLVTANTMSQSIRERTNELAVLKTLGFSRRRVTGLVLAEALLMTLLGGALGLLIGTVLVKLIAIVMQQYLPTMAIPSHSYALGATCMIVLGTLSGLLPAMQAWQLKITEALRRN